MSPLYRSAVQSSHYWEFRVPKNPKARRLSKFWLQAPFFSDITGQKLRGIRHNVYVYHLLWKLSCRLH